nr:unnamed protein product [Digitaria exilis]
MSQERNVSNRRELAFAARKMAPPANGDDDHRQASWREEATASGPSTERVFEGEPVPAASEMITARSVAVSIVLGATLSVMAMRLSLSSGYLPVLTVPAGLMSVFLSRSWVRLLNGCGVAQLPFTRQENALIQTFVVACSDIAYSGGFGSYILAMSRSSAEDGGADDAGGRNNVEEPHMGRLVAFLFLTSFAGMFAVMPFRNSLIIRHHLTFPTGTATAHLINSMHTPHGAKQAMCWLFAGGDGCGFQSFPIFGLAAARNGFFFDFSMTNIGVGLFSPYNITISMLAGSLLANAVLTPYVKTKEGIWYPRGNHFAYGMFIGISMVLADGLFHLLCILLRTLRAIHKHRHSQLAAQPFMCLGVDDRPPPARSFDDRRRAQVFLRDRVFDPAAVAGYVALSASTVVLIPRLYPQLRSGHAAFAYLVAPVFAFCNAYGTGVTDVSAAPTYGRIAVVAFGSWVGIDNGGLVAGLAAGVVLVSAVSTASDLMQVFRTGYLTLTSPHAVFVSQIAGTALGCVINPLIFWMLYPSVYNGGGGHVASYSKMYRGMVELALSQQVLPRHSVMLCKVFLAMVLAVGVLREVSARRGWCVGRYLPCTIAVAVAFFLPPEIPVGMFVGSVVACLWRRIDGGGARARLPAVGAGLICGDGIWSLLRTMLLVSNAQPPMCIMFLQDREVRVRQPSVRRAQMEPPANGHDGDRRRPREEEYAAAAAGPSTEQVFEGEPVPTPSEMITARSVGVGVVLGAMLSIVAMKLSLTSVYLPFLTIPAGLMSFFLSRWWVRLLHGCGVAQLPFTRQENTVIQTFAVSCTNIAYTGGFGSYILAMSRSSADDEGGIANSGRNVEEPQIGRLVAFLFLTNFIGIFAVMPFRNSLIIRHYLTFPTGTATAHLINNIHTPQGWLFEGGAHCGFRSFPIFGLAAARLGFTFDFSMTDIGIGLLSPYKVTISMLAGSILSWGIMLPYIVSKEGCWYPSGIGGLNAYRWFIGISMILADALFQLVCILVRTLRAMHSRRQSRLSGQPSICLGADDHRRPARSFDDRRRAQVFLRDRVYDPAAVVGYVALSAVSIVAIPHLYPQLRSGYVAIAYLAAPLFAFCNAYGTGMTGVNLGPTYGKIAVLAFGSWVGLHNGGVVAGLAGGVVVLSAVVTASDLMQVFRTGYLTLTSPHAVLISTVAGTALGCVINPLIFWMLYGAYGGGDGAPVTPYAKVYRGMAILSVSQQDLPRHSVLLSKVFFAAALAISVLREVSERRKWRAVARYLPCNVAVAVAFFMPPKVPIGLFVGSVVMYLWKRRDGEGARMRSPAVAAGMICGDGLGSLLRSMLMLSRARPPVCMMFLSRGANKRLDDIFAERMMTTLRTIHAITGTAAQSPPMDRSGHSPLANDATPTQRPTPERRSCPAPDAAPAQRPTPLLPSAHPATAPPLPAPPVGPRGHRSFFRLLPPILAPLSAFSGAPKVEPEPLRPFGRASVEAVAGAGAGAGALPNGPYLMTTSTAAQLSAIRLLGSEKEEELKIHFLLVLSSSLLVGFHRPRAPLPIQIGDPIRGRRLSALMAIRGPSIELHRPAPLLSGGRGICFSLSAAKQCHMM